MKIKSLELLLSIKKHHEFFIRTSKAKSKEDVEKLKNQIDDLEKNKIDIQKKIKKMFFNKEEITHYIDFLRNNEVFLQKLNNKLRNQTKILEENSLKLENAFRKRKTLEKIIMKHYSKNMRCFNFEQVD